MKTYGSEKLIDRIQIDSAKRVGRDAIEDFQCRMYYELGMKIMEFGSCNVSIVYSQMDVDRNHELWPTYAQSKSPFVLLRLEMVIRD